MGPHSLSITAVVLTLDEEQNLPACLASLQGWCSKIFVVDSGSTDRTLEIARSYSAEIVTHAFETHTKQWNWALQNLPLSTEWVLALDADHRVSLPLQQEILAALPAAPEQVAGYYVPRKQIFRKQWIRHGGYWPKYLLKIFRRGRASCDETELMDSHFYVRGETLCLRQPIVEQNLKEESIGFWLQKHLRYIELLAQEEFLARSGTKRWPMLPKFWGNPDQRVLWYKQRWYRLPLYVRPFLYFGYRYFLQFGFLDGIQGNLFHFLQGFWLRLMVDVRLAELERNHAHTRH